MTEGLGYEPEDDGLGQMRGLTRKSAITTLGFLAYSEDVATKALDQAVSARHDGYALERHRVEWVEGAGFEITARGRDALVDAMIRRPDLHDHEEALDGHAPGCPACMTRQPAPPYPFVTPVPAFGHDLEWVRQVIRMADAWLDGDVAGPYKDQPLAQDWGRTAKVTEEIGEAQEDLRDWRRAALDQARLGELDIPAGRAVEALIGYTGQNPRKGVHKDRDDVLSELTDVVCTGLFAIQHFTKDEHATWQWVLAGLAKALSRVPEGYRGPSEYEPPDWPEDRDV